MSRKYKGFSRKKVFEFFSQFICMVHRQHLVAKMVSYDLKSTLTQVIKVVILIKPKQHALNTRLFKKLGNEKDENFETLVMHTEVR